MAFLNPKIIPIFLFYSLVIVSFFLNGNDYLPIILFQSIFFISIVCFFKNDLFIYIKSKKLIHIVGFFLIITSLSASYFLSPIRTINGLHNGFDGMLIRYLATISHLLFYFSFLIFVKKEILDFSRLIKFFFIIFFLYSFLWLMSSRIDLRFMGIDLFDDNVRHVGYLFTFFISLFMAQYAWIISKRKNIKEEFLVKTILFLSLSLYFTFIGGRGALLSMIICLIVLVTLLRKSNPSQVKIYLSNILIIGILSVIFSISLSQINSRYVEIKGVGQHKLLKTQLTNIYNFSSNRFYIWKKVLLNNYKPIIGMGPNSYLHIRDNDKELTKIRAIQPHNIFLQLYLEWGLSGTFFLFIFLFKKLKTLNVNFYSSNYNQINIISVSACAGLFFHSLFDGTLFYSQTVLLFIIFLVFGCNNNNLGKFAIYKKNRDI